jgi:hypothetical protein
MLWLTTSSFSKRMTVSLGAGLTSRTRLYGTPSAGSPSLITGSGERLPETLQCFETSRNPEKRQSP